MANDLTNLIPHIEEVRTRLSQTANTERSLVEQLSDALKRFDQDTLQSIRNVASEHEARRSGIFNELQALAGRIGTFLPARETVEPVAIQQHDAPARGDWRQAVKTISYHDELEADLHALLNEGSRH
jgi:hypothetical protein